MISIRDEYEKTGVKAFYATKGSQYSNPHEHLVVRALSSIVKDWNVDISNTLDLAAGSGEVSQTILRLGGKVSAIDPFTYEAYRKRIGQNADRFTFEDIAAGTIAQRRYSMIICSYAMHLVEPSRLPLLLYRLSEVSSSLLILTPHKRPEIKDYWALKKESVFNGRRINYHRTRCRLYTKV